MRKGYFGTLLASTAIAAALTGIAAASPFTSVETSIPVPEPANVAPPTARDATGRPSQSAPAERFGTSGPAPTAPASRPVAAPVGPVTAAPATSAQAPSAQSPSAQARPEPQVNQPAPAVRAASPSEPVKVEQNASSSAAPNVAVTDKLRDLIANRQQMERIAPRKNEREAIVALYQNNRAPLWIDIRGQSDRARAAIAHLRNIDADGLDPADYPVPNFSATSPEALAEAELRFTAALLTYARHALNGRVHWSRVSPNIDYKDAFDPADVLGKLAGNGDVAATLDSFNPQHAGYKALKAKYIELRDQAAQPGPARIESGPVLRYGRDRQGREVMMVDPRVPAVRARLGLPAEPGNAYNRALADAVVKFQKANGLQANGQLGAATINALNPPSRDKQLSTILANLERWRWVPRDFGRIHVALNIPDYHLRVMNNNQLVWTTRVVVGKPNQATPLISETMKYITVNPTWNVPQSIIYNELLPIYESSDRGIFDRMGLRVEQGRDGIRVYQPPGERNALGRIRFNFPNKFLVYQHDTPEKHYFAHDKRAYSHGCMRVQDPIKYAEVLLSLAAPRGNYTQDSIRRMYGGEERQIDFQNHIPVHLTYQTAFVDDAGKLQFRDDVYSLDSALLKVMKGEERRVADIAVDRPSDPNFKPTGTDRARLQNVARGTTANPFALFDQLFR
jgi:murein L,D-transpeptidase YcbB/YkuD